MKELKSLRFLWHKSPEGEVHYEYFTGASYPKIGECREIIEHSEGDHYEVRFDNVTMNVHCKDRVVTTKDKKDA